VIDEGGGVVVRAERSGEGNGRVYTIWFTASDGQGGESAGSVQVCVPHDNAHLDCVDDGQSYNSLGPCHDGSEPVAAAAIALSAPVVSGNSTTLEYSLAATSDVLLAVYDVAGRRIATLVHAPQNAGVHSVTWNASGLARGVYFYRLTAGADALTRRLLLLR